MEHVSSVGSTGKFPEKVENIKRWVLRPAPPPPGYCGAFARLVSRGGRAFANPRAIPELFWHARGFLSEYNYTEGF